MKVFLSKGTRKILDETPLDLRRRLEETISTLILGLMVRALFKTLLILVLVSGAIWIL